MKFKPYNYQKTAIRFILDHPASGLFLDMGLGKTVSTLTAIHRLMDDGEAEKTLVVAPKKVAESTWSTECEKWDHLRDLRVSVVLGSEKKRKQALEEDADIYVTGRDNFTWLIAYYGGARFPFDILVLDELTSFKSANSIRFKALKQIRPLINRVIGLTGTPAPNGLKDLWGQIYALDMGERLGKTQGRYHQQYFDCFSNGQRLVRCDIRKGCEEQIYSRISDIVISMKASDYLELPEMIERTIEVNLPECILKKYNDFEKESVLEFNNQMEGKTENIIANGAGALVNKLGQFANGAIYDDEKNVHELHDEKIEALTEIVEAANGQSILVFYQYQHDYDRIRRKLKGYSVRKYSGDKELTDWNAGKIEVLLAHPASTAYGLNMQAGGHIVVWFGTGWNLELYMQANARLYRQGQQHPVTIYRLITKGTIDEDAFVSITKKTDKQEALLQAVKARIKKYLRS